MSKHLTAGEIAELVEGRLEGPAGRTVNGVESLQEASPEHLSFLSDARYTDALKETNAGVLMLPDNAELPSDIPTEPCRIYCSDPANAITSIYLKFAPEMEDHSPGIHSAATVAPEADFPGSAHVGAQAVVQPNASVGKDSVIGPGCFIGRNVSIGDRCHLHPNVTVRANCVLGNDVIIHSGTVIGSDGFGYIPGDNGSVKIPQVGIVEIHDDVELGALVAVDRARFGRTIIKEGTKVDNLVQIAHNVVIGKNCILVAQTAIAGSTRLGNDVTTAGQAGIAGHIEIGDNSIVMAQAGVTRDLPENSTVFGTPAMDRKEFTKRSANVKSIPTLKKRIQELESELETLKSQLE